MCFLTIWISSFEKFVYKRSEQILLGSKGEVREWWKGGGGQWGEVAQTMYIRMNKYKNKKKS
jgi:hypothetical protein